MTSDQRYVYNRNAWQVTLVDLLALLLCFFVLQYALNLPNAPSLSISSVSKRQIEMQVAKKWFLKQDMPHVSLSYLSNRSMHLIGKLETLNVEGLNQLKCELYIVQPSSDDLTKAQILLKELQSEGLRMPSSIGFDSHVNKLTMIIDLENCL